MSFRELGSTSPQYIQDNIEEQLSGVKGANSVKIIGRDLATSGADRGPQVFREMGKVKGRCRSRNIPRPGTAELEHRGRSRRRQRVTASMRVMSITSFRRRWADVSATTVLEAERQFNVDREARAGIP